MAGRARAGGGTPAPSASAGGWSSLRQAAAATPTGARLASEAELRQEGRGPPHTKARLRLFDAKDASMVRTTLYRDTAAWCPYCQKIWLQLEEKRIPYRVELINMRSYGPKPQEFLERVPGGLLPALEIDGKLFTESLQIMQLIEAEFSDFGPAMFPSPGDPALARAKELLALERDLFGAWCQLVFRPDETDAFGGLLEMFGVGPASGDEKQGESPSRALLAFEAKLGQVDAALGETPGPWFLGGEAPSIVDLQYVSHIERMNASVLYWKGVKLRGSGRFPALDAWFDAFEGRAAYAASKSDYLTHVRAIPPQYGPGFESSTPAQQAAEAAISGNGSAWRLPLALGPEDLEPLSPALDLGEEAARHEAAFALTGNAAAVATFATRGMGEPGRPAYSAPLADPNARPNPAFEEPVTAALQAVAEGLLAGTGKVDLRGGVPAAAAEGTARCLAYLRERVGVPRDMGHHAAMQLRAYLNLAIDELDARG